MRTFALLPVILLLTFSCRTTTPSETLDAVVNQDGDDTRLLVFDEKRHEVIGHSEFPSLGGIAIDRRECPVLPGQSPNIPEDRLQRDCRAEVEKHLDSPVASTMNMSIHSSGLCQLITVITLSKTSFAVPEGEGYDNFVGIGFHLAGTTDGRGFTVPKEKLKIHFDHRENGLPYIEHKFHVKGMCYGLGGNVGSILRRYYEIKPYAEFRGDDGNTYRVWENRAENYVIRPSEGPVKSVDNRSIFLP